MLVGRAGRKGCHLARLLGAGSHLSIAAASTPAELASQHHHHHQQQQQQRSDRSLHCRVADSEACTCSTARSAVGGGCLPAASAIWPSHLSRGFASGPLTPDGLRGGVAVPGAGVPPTSGLHGSGSGNGSDGDKGSSNARGNELTPVSVPHREEDEVDELLTQWEALMDADADPMEMLDTVWAHVEDEQGLPSWEEILARGNEEEALERAARRSRERALQQEFAHKRVRVVDRFGRSYATGKRKTSIARTWIKPGTGSIKINGRPLQEYFPPLLRRADVLSPFLITNTLGAFDVYATVRGGGLTGQAQAVRHGIARALQLFDLEARPPLKAAGLLTRDARIVERKKPGLAKARRAFQWVKR